MPSTSSTDRYPGLVPLSDGELRRLKEEEMVLRRKTRLQKVREQERAKSIVKLRRYQRRVEKENEQIQKAKGDELSSIRNKQIENLEQQLRHALKEFGSGHHAAVQLNEDAMVLAGKAKRLAEKRAHEEQERAATGLQVHRQQVANTAVHRFRAQGIERKRVWQNVSKTSRRKAKYYHDQIEKITQQTDNIKSQEDTTKSLRINTISEVPTQGKSIVDFGKTRMHTMIVQHPRNANVEMPEMLNRSNAFEAAILAKEIQKSQEEASKKRATQLDQKRKQRSKRAGVKLQVHKDLQTLETQLALLQRTGKNIAATSAGLQTVPSNTHRELEEADTQAEMERAFETQFLRGAQKRISLRSRKSIPSPQEPQPRTLVPVPRGSDVRDRSVSSPSRKSSIMGNEPKDDGKLRPSQTPPFTDRSKGGDSGNEASQSHTNAEHHEVPSPRPLGDVLEREQGSIKQEPETPLRNKALDKIFLNQSAPTPIAVASPFAAYAKLKPNAFIEGEMDQNLASPLEKNRVETLPTLPSDSQSRNEEETKEISQSEFGNTASKTPERKPIDLSTQLDMSLRKYLFSSDDDADLVERAVEAKPSPSRLVEKDETRSLDSSLLGLSGDEGDSVLLENGSTNVDLAALAASVNRALGEFGIRKLKGVAAHQVQESKPSIADSPATVGEDIPISGSKPSKDEGSALVVEDESWKTDPLFAEFAAEFEEALKKDDGSEQVQQNVVRNLDLDTASESNESFSNSLRYTKSSGGTSSGSERERNVSQQSSAQVAENVDHLSVMEDTKSFQAAEVESSTSTGDDGQSDSVKHFTLGELEERLNSALEKLQATSSIVTTPTEDGHDTNDLGSMGNSIISLDSIVESNQTLPASTTTNHEGSQLSNVGNWTPADVDDQVGTSAFSERTESGGLVRGSFDEGEISFGFSQEGKSSDLNSSHENWQVDGTETPNKESGDEFEVLATDDASSPFSFTSTKVVDADASQTISAAESSAPGSLEQNAIDLMSSTASVASGDISPTNASHHFDLISQNSSVQSVEGPPAEIPTTSPQSSDGGGSETLVQMSKEMTSDPSLREELPNEWENEDHRTSLESIGVASVSAGSIGDHNSLASSDHLSNTASVSGGLAQDLDDSIAENTLLQSKSSFQETNSIDSLSRTAMDNVDPNPVPPFRSADEVTGGAAVTEGDTDTVVTEADIGSAVTDALKQVQFGSNEGESPTQTALRNAQQAISGVRKSVDDMFSSEEDQGSSPGQDRLGSEGMRFVPPIYSSSHQPESTAQRGIGGILPQPDTMESSMALLSDANEALQRVRALVSDVDTELTFARSSNESAADASEGEEAGDGQVTRSRMSLSTDAHGDNESLKFSHSFQSQVGAKMSENNRMHSSSFEMEGTSSIDLVEEEFLDSPTVQSMIRSQELLKQSAGSFSAASDITGDSIPGRTVTPFRDWAATEAFGREDDGSPTIQALEHSSSHVQDVLETLYSQGDSSIATQFSDSGDGSIQQPISIQKGDSGVAMEYTTGSTSISKANQRRQLLEERSKQRAREAKMRAATRPKSPAKRTSKKKSDLSASTSTKQTSASKAPANMPPEEVMQRLAHGERAKLSKQDIRATNERLYAKLPEVRQRIEKERLQKSAEERRRRVREMEEKRRKDMLRRGF